MRRWRQNTSILDSFAPASPTSENKMNGLNPIIVNKETETNFPTSNVTVRRRRTNLLHEACLSPETFPSNLVIESTFPEEFSQRPPPPDMSTQSGLRGLGWPEQPRRAERKCSRLPSQEPT